MSRNGPRTPTHGGGEACYKLGLPSCDECRAWKARQKREEAHTHGTYKFDYDHGLGYPGLKRRIASREKANRADLQRIKELLNG